MATGLANVGSSFGGPSNSLVSRSKFPSTSIEEDDDVVFVELVQPPQISTPLVTDHRNVFNSSSNEERHGNDPKVVTPMKDLSSQKGSITETIIIDDEEDKFKFTCSLINFS